MVVWVLSPIFPHHAWQLGFTHWKHTLDCHEDFLVFSSKPFLEMWLKKAILTLWMNLGKCQPCPDGEIRWWYVTGKGSIKNATHSFPFASITGASDSFLQTGV